MILSLLLIACLGGLDTGADSDTHSADSDPAIDADGDGYATPVDCDDAESSHHPDAVEDCADGADDDCDHLLDCEDGDCALASACGETDCSDGLDDDGDGPADCQDVECVGLGDCPSAVLRVLGGHGTIRREKDRLSKEYSHNTSSVIDLDLSSITGVVAERSPSGAVVSCDWSAAGVHWRARRGGYYSCRPDYGGTTTVWRTSSSSWERVDPVARSSVSIDGGCSTDLADAHPRFFEFSWSGTDPTVSTGGLPWYAPVVSWSALSTTRRWSSGERGYRYSTTTFRMDTLEGGVAVPVSDGS